MDMDASPAPSSSKVYPLLLDTPIRIDADHTVIWRSEGHEELAPPPGFGGEALLEEHVALHALHVERSGAEPVIYRHAGSSFEGIFFEVLVRDAGFALSIHHTPDGDGAPHELLVTPYAGAPLTEEEAIDLARQHPALQACEARRTTPAKGTSSSWVGLDDVSADHHGLIAHATLFEGDAEPSSCSIVLGVYSGRYTITGSTAL